MLKIGDRVVYPMHGAGEITGVEENEVGGVKNSYFIFRLPMGDMKVTNKPTTKFIFRIPAEGDTPLVAN